MKVVSINGINNAKNFAFKGMLVEETSRSYGYPETHLNAALKTGRRYEKTLGSYHTDEKYKIYYADPLEKVSDAIKDQVDYVFYDDEPRFPDIEKEVSTRYFYEPKPFQENYGDSMNEYRKYFYRMEMSDAKHANHYENLLRSDIDINDSKEKLDYYRARIADAKYNQETAAGCMDIYGEASEKIGQKDNIYRRICDLKGAISAHEADIPLVDKELEQRTELENILKTKISNLKSRENAYKKIQTALTKADKENKAGVYIAERAAEHNYEQSKRSFGLFNCSDVIESSPYAEEYDKAGSLLKVSTHLDQEEKNIIDKQLNIVSKKLSDYLALEKENKTILDKITEYKEKLPSILDTYKKELAEKSIAYDRVKGELMQYFDALKNYFYSRGLKNVKY